MGISQTKNNWQCPIHRHSTTWHICHFRLYPFLLIVWWLRVFSSVVHHLVCVCASVYPCVSNCVFSSAVYCLLPDSNTQMRGQPGSPNIVLSGYCVCVCVSALVKQGHLHCEQKASSGFGGKLQWDGHKSLDELLDSDRLVQLYLRHSSRPV